MRKIGDKVKSIAHEGTFQIVASRKEPKKIHNQNIPPKDFDYALKRIDGYMESDFEPYEYVTESMIKKI